MSESQDTDTASVGGAETSAEQLLSGIHGHGISSAAIESAHRFLQAIGVYTKLSMDRQMAQTHLKNLETFVRANPAQRAQKMTQINDAKTRVSQAETQEAQVKSVVGVRLVQIVGGFVQQELAQTTADIVRQTEERCRAEAKKELDTVRQAYEAQLQTIQQAAVEAARAEVAKGIAAFEQSRTAAASFMVPESSSSASAADVSSEVVMLQAAHNKLAESFADFAQQTSTHIQEQAQTAAEKAQTASESASAFAASNIVGATGHVNTKTSAEVVYEAITNLNERMQKLEDGANEGPSFPRRQPPAKDRNTGASSSNATDSSRLESFWADPNPARLAELSPLEADFILMTARLRQVDLELDWLIEQQAETWALVQLAHVAWGSERLATRDFVRQMLEATDNATGAPATSVSPNGTALR
ncbi:hypothetical protein OC835_005224 [Tilletia horrida]|nr:hypothetical protein OC835_005224 [Tilletia horrida]